MFNSIPLEGDIIWNINSDFNTKSFFALAPGLEYNIGVKKSNMKPYKEKWKAEIDLWGNRFLEDEKLNRMYFFSGIDYFSCLDFKGSANSALFQFYISAYRVPFIFEKSKWSDRISYKYFSSIPVLLLKDLIHPFSDRVSFDWNAEMIPTNSGLVIEADVSHLGKQNIYNTSLRLQGKIPGEINTFDGRDEWEIKPI